jgi:hypothetical protein
MVGFNLSVLDELTPAEAVLLEHFRALPLESRRALLDALDRGAAEFAAGPGLPASPAAASAPDPAGVGD